MSDTLTHQELIPPPKIPATNSYGRGYSAAPYPLEGDSSDDDSGGIVEYWRMLRRRRGTLILIAFIGLVASVLVTLPQTPIYRARTAVEIQNVNTDFLNSRQVSPVSEDSSAMNGSADVQTQMKIIQSEYLLDRVLEKVKQQGRIKNVEARFSPLSALRKLLNVASASPADQEYALHQRAMKSLTVRQMGQTRVIEILYTSPDPKLAAEFANTLTAEYIESNMEARWKMSEHTEEWLSKQLDEMRVKLERSEDSLQAYARQAGLLFTSPSSGSSEKSNVSEDKLRQLQEELSKAQADRGAAQSAYETAKSAPPETVGDVLSDSSLRELQGKLTDLRRQEAELITTYTPKHEKVLRIQAQIAPLELAFNAQRNAILSRIRNDYDTAVRRETFLQADYTAQTGIVTDQADKSIQYNILKRDVESNRQLYQNMLQQMKEASVASAIRASNVRIVDPARPPHKPYSPVLPLNAAVGLMAGLVSGIIFVITRERADRTLQEPGDVTFWTHLPELGVIPSESVGRGKRGYGYYNKIYGRAKESATVTDPDSISDSIDTSADLQQLAQLASSSDSQPDSSQSSRKGKEAVAANDPIELISWKHKPSIVAEAFRTVLTSIMFSGENGTRPRVLVMTSASPMDGKTTVVSNLGIAMAEIRQKVLIIDADLRKPRMHQIFDLKNEKGLGTLLRGTELGDNALDGLIQQTSVPGLSVLPSGPSTHASASLLYSPHLRVVFAKLKAEYDMILVDTPPSLQMTDARVIGRIADAMILVTRANKTTREAAIAVSQRFQEDRTRILGTILNDWNPKTSRNGYYGYYKGQNYGSYRYGYHEPPTGSN